MKAIFFPPHRVGTMVAESRRAAGRQDVYIVNRQLSLALVAQQVAGHCVFGIVNRPLQRPGLGTAFLSVSFSVCQCVLIMVIVFGVAVVGTSSLSN